MQKKHLFSLSLISFLGLVIGAFWWFNDTAAQAEKKPAEKHPFEAINNKAKDARRGDVETAKELVSEVIAVSGFENELRGFTSNSIKERVGNAESLYQQGQGEGISEGNVARTINGLAIKFNLPAFAKTDTYEVRKLRLSLLPSFPEIIGKKLNGTQPLFAGSSFDSKMSPAEAILILSMMMNQKLSNKNYQLTHAEQLIQWEEKYGKQRGRSKVASLEEITKNRSAEINLALQRSAEALSIPNALQLSTLILNTLGIEQHTREVQK